MSKAAQLPAHLSHKVALVLLPPASIAAPIERIRREHDRHFKRWPPHINLLYPFLSAAAVESSDDDLSQIRDDDGELVKAHPIVISPSCQARLVEAMKQIQPFRIVLPCRPGHFQHSRRSSTVWLRPTAVAEDGGKGTTTTALRDLQTALQTAFAEVDGDGRPFEPHLSVGQAGGGTSAMRLIDEVEKVIARFMEDSGPSSMTDGQAAGDGNRAEQQEGLQWFVDRVYVIARKGYAGRFKIIGQATLGEQEVS